MFLFVCLISLFIGIVMLLLMVIVSLWQDFNINSVSSYECGFDPKSMTRMTFSYRFFLISILFLIFDVEISLLLPIPFISVSLYSYVLLMMFIFFLLLGLIYESYLGSLDWL
uniref:NADH-ubiquinone oxidoreductase chain 3 n=1 Tax=Harpactocrates apennicola TaxID=1110479 RepID=A0A516IMC6_9ARAC|nr:NADH dehydrogenase subunit 3 [Harpactocrates apennicola]QDP17923.1 NADH dehydrogenase subunit 3 [Harpactocrates apennicola]